MFRKLFGGGGKHQRDEPQHTGTVCPGSSDGLHTMQIWSDTTKTTWWETCENRGCTFRRDLPDQPDHLKDIK